MVEYRHHVVPGDDEDPGRREGRPTLPHLKLCHVIRCAVEHYLGVHA